MEPLVKSYDCFQARAFCRSFGRDRRTRFGRGGIVRPFNLSKFFGTDLKFWVRSDMGVSFRNTDFNFPLAFESWTLTGADVPITNDPDPQGGTRARFLREDDSLGVHKARGPVAAAPPTGASFQVTYSVRAKANGRNWIKLVESGGTYSAFFNLGSGVVGTVAGSGASAEIVSLGDGWYNCILKVTANTVASTYAEIFLSTNGVATSYQGEFDLLEEPPIENGVLLYFAECKNNAVTSWANQAPEPDGSFDSNKNAVQATAANQPSFSGAQASLGGRATIGTPFDSTSDQYLVTGNWTVDPALPMTVLVVYMRNRADAGNMYVYDARNPTATQFALYEDVGNQMLHYSGGNWMNDTNFTANNAGTAILTRANVTTPRNHVKSKTATQFSSSAPSAPDISGFTLCAPAVGGAAYIGVQMAEFAVINRDLTTDEISKLFDYVQQTYFMGIAA